MKKTLSSLALVFLILSASGCQFTVSTDNNGETGSGKEDSLTQNASDVPAFSTDYELTPDIAEYMSAMESFDTMASASPYYMGNAKPEIPGIKGFYEAREKKVREAVKLTDDLYEQLKDFNGQFVAFHTGFLNYIYLAGSLEENLDVEFANNAIDQVAAELALMEGLSVNHETLKKTASETKDAFSRTYLEYLRTANAQKLYDITIQSAANTLANAQKLSTLLTESGTNEKSKTLVEKMDSIFETVSELGDSVDEINNTMLALNIAQAQILTGDYHMNLAAMDYIDNEMPTLEGKIKALKTSGDLSENGVETIKSMSEIYASASKTMRNLVNETDQNQLLKFKNEPIATRGNYFIPVAKAGVKDSLYNAYNSVAATTSAVVSSGVDFGGRFIDNSVTAGKMGIKYAKLTAGTAVDAVGAVVKAPADAYFGWKYDLSAKQIRETQNENFRQLGRNFLDEKVGAETFRQGVEYMNQLEKMGKSAGEYIAEKGADAGAAVVEGALDWASEKIAGGPLSPDGTFKKTVVPSTKWLIGKAGGITGMATVGLFTGFAKGTYQLANIESTNYENAEGMLSVGLSFMGTSAAVLKPSQIAVMGKDATKMYLNRGYAFIKEATSATKGSGLEKLAKVSESLFGAEAALTKSIIGATTNSRAVTAALKAEGVMLEKEAAEYLKQGTINALKENLKGIPAEFSDFVIKQFDDNISGYLSALKSGLGKNFPDYLDNLFASKMDSLIMGTIEYVIAGDEPTGLDPLLGEYKGIYKLMNFFDAPVTGTYHANSFEAEISLDTTGDNGVRTYPIHIDVSFKAKTDNLGNITSGQITGYGEDPVNKNIRVFISGEFSGKVSGNTIRLKSSITTNQELGYAGDPGRLKLGADSYETAWEMTRAD